MFKRTPARQLLPALTMVCWMLTAVVAAASDDAQAPASPEESNPHIGGTDQPGAVVKGVVTYIGASPPRPPVAGLNKDPQCVKARGGVPLLSETFVFGKAGERVTLPNVLIYVSKGLEGRGFDPPKQPVVLDQIKCQYVPHVVAAMAGQPVHIKNSDDFLHNVMAPTIRNNPVFNKAMPVKGMVLKEKFANAEIGVMLSCAAHPWMRSYLHVLPHPYFAVTGEDGTFELRGLPDGEYEITVWHEFKRFFADKQMYEVTVKDGKAEGELKIVYDVRPLAPATPE